MSCIQVAGLGKPSVYLPDRAQLKRTYCTTRPLLYLPDRVQLKRIDCAARRSSLKLNATTYKHFPPGEKRRQKSGVLCLLGGKDKSGDEGSPWKDFSKSLGNFGKGKSVEDVLRQQIEKQEFYDGDGGKSPPRGRGGGGGGGGSGESGDEGFKGIMEETMQVFLATLGFIALYIYIIAGEEISLLIRDYIKYLKKGIVSNRLQGTIDAWQRFKNKLSEKKEYDKYWLEKEIINTPTWYDDPEKYRNLLRSYTKSQDDDDDENADDE